MEDQDEVCLCFHVSLQKVKKFIRLTHPKVASQISECYGAGTGCGWCIPFLEKTFEAAREGDPSDIKMSREEYLSRRRHYREKAKEKNRFRDET